MFCTSLLPSLLSLAARGNRGGEKSLQKRGSSVEHFDRRATGASGVFVYGMGLPCSAAESRNRLRVSGLNRRPLLIARIPELLSALRTPLCIQKDIPVVRKKTSGEHP